MLFTRAGKHVYYFMASANVSSLKLLDHKGGAFV